MFLLHHHRRTLRSHSTLPTLQMTTPKRPLWEYALNKKRAKVLKGAPAKGKQLRDLGIEPNTLSARARGVAMRRPELETTVLVYRRSGSRVPARLARMARSSGLVPAEPVNVQARPSVEVEKLIAQKAERLAPCGAGVKPAARACERVTVAPTGAALDRSMEDWSVEVALLKVQQDKGRIIVIEKAAPARAATETVAPRLLNTLVLACGAARPAALDLVHVLTFPLPWLGFVTGCFLDLSSENDSSQPIIVCRHLPNRGAAIAARRRRHRRHE